MNIYDGLENYVHKPYKAPEFRELCKKLGIDINEWSKEKNIKLIKARTLAVLEQAAMYAFATLNVILDLYQKNYLKESRKAFGGCLNELRAVVNSAKVSTWNNPHNEILEKATLDSRIENASTAVVHAGNIFNNSFFALPKEVKKAVLEARDFCNDAVAQPHVS